MTAQEAEAIADSDDIAYVEEDGKVYASLDTWGLDRIDQTDLPLDNAYTPYGNGAGVTTYILDTGILTSHEEFDNNRATWGINTTGDGNDTDCHGHGTHVAGTVVGKEYGVANQADTVAVKVLGCSGSGTWAGVISGVEWVMDNAIKPATANMSLGGGTNTALDTAVANLHNSGVPVAVAAGNNNGDACNYSPAGAPDVITVASSDSGDARSSFSNYGDCIEIFAPGSSIKSAHHTSDSAYYTMSGTSMASPHVCGGAALLLEAGVDPADVLTELENMATPDKITDEMGSPNLLLYVGGDPPGGDDCLDSLAFFKWKGKLRRCKFVEKFKKSMCKDDSIQRFCPNTCGVCDKYGCVDADLPFSLFKKKTLKQWTCEKLAKKPLKIRVNKCRRKKFYTTCRKTCETCTEK